MVSSDKLVGDRAGDLRGFVSNLCALATSFPLMALNVGLGLPCKFALSAFPKSAVLGGAASKSCFQIYLVFLVHGIFQLLSLGVEDRLLLRKLGSCDSFFVVAMDMQTTNEMIFFLEAETITPESCWTWVRQNILSKFHAWNSQL